MGYLIGTDEAGYGPNFGPLVVSATVWHVAGAPRGVDLYRRLGPAVARDGTGEAPQGVVWIADSKAVYRAGQGLAALERGVHAALACCQRRPGDWRDLWLMLTGKPAPTADADPCCGDFDCELPLEVPPEEIDGALATFGGALKAAGVRLVAVHSRAIFAREFNELVALHGGKGAALSQVTTELIADALEGTNAECGMRNAEHHEAGFIAPSPLQGEGWGEGKSGRRKPLTLPSPQGAEGFAAASDRANSALRTPHSALSHEPVWIVCDKHGGRNRYAPLLQQRFPETLIEVRGESRQRSVYRWRREGHAVEAHFCAGGERHLPVALASMVSKYLREVAMLAFNRFWSRRLPDLRPTAGYPTDAHRFRREIAAAQQALGMEDGVLWRSR
jgi:hypothetical protein